MSKTIKTFLVLSFITATCWAYLLGNYMGTRLSAGFHSVSSITGGGGWSSGRAPSGGGLSSSSIDTSGINIGGGAVDVSSIDLSSMGIFNTGSSGGITGLSNSGISGGIVDRTKSIDVSAYAKAYDGNIDKMIAAIKSDFLRAPTAGEYQAAARKISGENKFSALSVAAVAELHSSWLTDYFEWTEGLTPDQIDNIVSAKINEVAEKYGIPITEARALLMEVDGIIAEQPGADSSLIGRLDKLSINDPLFTGAKENVLLQTAIAEAVPETSASLPAMSGYQKADFDATVTRLEQDYGLDSNQAREVATNYYFGESNEDNWLGDKWSCPLMSKDLAPIIQEVTGESARDAYGRAAYEQDIIRFSNYYQIDQNQAKEALDLYLSDHISGNMWIEKDPTDGEFKEDYLEVGPETGVGYPICPIMSNDIQSYSNYAVGAGPRPEAPTPEDIAKIQSGQFSEMDVDKTNEIQGTLGAEGQQMGQDEIYQALMLAMNDSEYNKQLSQSGNALLDDSTYEKMMGDIDASDIKNYDGIMDQVGDAYGLETNDAMAVLIRHIVDQRTINSSYKLSEEGSIIESINNSNTYDIIKNIKDAKTEAGIVSAVAVDLNCDGNINLVDMAILLSFWGKDPSKANSCQSPDINQDGKVNLTDFSIMMSYWNYVFK